MDKTVQIMDLPVCIMDRDCFCEKVEGYLQKPKFNVILLASGQLFKEVFENEYLYGMISKADMIVPGEKAVLSLHHADLLQKGGIIVNYSCLADVLDYLRKTHYTVYIVAREKLEIDYMKKFFWDREYNISVEGVKIVHESEDDAIINEINSLSPDILLIDLDTPLQEKWIMEHSTKVNVRLCVGLGGIMKQVMEEYKEPPRLIEQLHLTKPYKYFRLRERFMRMRREMMFKRVVKEYKKKRGTNEN